MTRSKRFSRLFGPKTSQNKLICKVRGLVGELLGHEKSFILKGGQEEEHGTDLRAHSLEVQTYIQPEESQDLNGFKAFRVINSMKST